MNSDKIFFVLDPDWPKNRWLGHLYNYHTYFVHQLISQGYQVISISPDPDKVLQLLCNFSVADLSKVYFASYDELQKQIEALVIPPPLPEPEPELLVKKNNKSLIALLKSIVIKLSPEWLLRFYRKLVGKEIDNRIAALEEIQIESESDTENLEKIPDEVKKTHFEFEKFNNYINLIVKKYNFEASKIFVLFPYVDTYVYYDFNGETVDTVLNFPWYGMWIQVKNCQEEVKLARLSFFNCKNCKGIGVLEDDKVEKLQSVFPLTTITLFPDIITETRTNKDYLLAKHFRAAANNRKIIGLLGRLNEDKGIINFLKTSIQASNNNNQDYFFVLLGGGLFHSQEFITLLNEASENENNIIYLHSITKDEDFDSVFNECDIIYAAYRNFSFSSNTLAKAALYEKPVIVSSGFLMQQRVEKYQIGVAIEQDNPTETLFAIECLLKKQDLRGMPLAFEFKKFKSENSYEQFGMALHELIKES